MKVWIAAAMAGMALAACSPPQQAAAPTEAQRPIEIASGVYPLDPHHTTMVVRVPHFGLSSYQLRFNEATGELNFNAEDPTQSSVTLSVDTTSIDTPYANPNHDFDQDLQNSQWLDTATHPIATFRSTSVERTGPNTARVTGDLSIRGVTHPATFDVTYNASHARHPAGPNWSMIGFSARGTISRSQYGMAEGVPSAPGASDGIGDQIELQFEVEFMKDNEAQPAAPAQPAN